MSNYNGASRLQHALLALRAVDLCALQRTLGGFENSEHVLVEPGTIFMDQS